MCTPTYQFFIFIILIICWPLVYGDQITNQNETEIPVVHLSPHIQETPMTEAIPTIPLGVIAPFLTQPYITNSNQIKHAPYVVGFPDEHIIAGLNDSFYVRKLNAKTDARFQVFRPGNELRDPENNNILGYEAQFIANANVELTGDPARLIVTQMAREIELGDRLIPLNIEQPLMNFTPHPAPAGTRGRIVSMLNGVSEIGRYNLITINRGTADKIEPGHLLTIYSGGELKRDIAKHDSFNSDWRHQTPFSTEFWFGEDYIRQGWRRDEPDANEPLPIHADFRRESSEYIQPFEPAGTLMIFRAFEHISFAIVLNAKRGIQIGDQIAATRSNQ